MNREEFKIEICANSVESVKAAFEAGADRVELCAGMPEGGTTPSYGTIAMARDLAPRGLHVIIRPRSGDFLYNDLERETMLRDIELARRLGADGVVFGCLTADGDVDRETMRLLMEAAQGMSVTFHRAFDMCRNPFAALQAIEDLGCHRILTSGQEATAEAGIPLLRQLTEHARHTLIMPGCGINAANIAAIAAATGAREFHLSARTPLESAMRHRNPRVSMGGTVQVAEYGRDATDPRKVKEVIGRLLQ